MKHIQPGEKVHSWGEKGHPSGGVVVCPGGVNKKSDWEPPKGAPARVNKKLDSSSIA